MTHETQLPHVSSEGGPILIGDFVDLCHWNGSDLALYNHACTVESFAVMPIEFGGKRFLSWDFGGPGTAFLVKSEKTETVLLRYWSDSELSDSAIAGLVEVGDENIATTSFMVVSGRVLVIWAAEDARNILAPANGCGRPKGPSIEDAGYLILLNAGTYEVKSSHYFKNQIEVASLRLLRFEDTEE
jgi:hypothetical protein